MMAVDWVMTLLKSSRLALLLGLASLAFSACGPDSKHSGTEKADTSSPAIQQDIGAGQHAQQAQKGKLPLPLTAMYGATVLQTNEVKLDSPLARDSFERLKSVGANTAVMVPFMKQDRPQSDQVDSSGSVTDAQLIAGINSAHAAGMQVILKPQILVGGAWAGAVNPGSAQGWDRWFASYQTQIIHYAEIAQTTKSELFVVGTELKQADKLPHWRGLIAAVRKVYGGKITYAAHNLDGIEQYAHWDLLDMLGVTLYPSLGRTVDHQTMRDTMQQVVAGLSRLHEQSGKPILVAEVGIPSVYGAQAMPWDYSKKKCDAPADAQLQALVLDLWLETLNKPWISGVLVWNWYSDPYAGGRYDTDYTVQNKPAEAVLRCRWGVSCGGKVTPAG